MARNRLPVLLVKVADESTERNFRALLAAIQLLADKIEKIEARLTAGGL